jgi:monofunctional biosynthetic peptidoglycan transglycosylase
MRRKSFGRRLVKWIGILALAWIAITVTPVLMLRWFNPLTSAFMLRDPNPTRYEWVNFDRISPNAALAVIASEDQQFPYHFGFDLKSIREAQKHNEHSKRMRGASTISQQVAKNLFLWSGRSYVRKGMEAWFTMLIEALWPKQRVLEIYLNIAQMGRGVYGVEAAAKQFFHKPAARLTRAEAATLAAVLPNPRHFRADKPSRYVTARRDWILGQMRMLGGRTYLRRMEPQRP